MFWQESEGLLSCLLLFIYLFHFLVINLLRFNPSSHPLTLFRDGEVVCVCVVEILHLMLQE